MERVDIGQRSTRLVKEGSWIVVGQLGSALGALVLVRVLTEYLSPAQYGQLALGLTVATLVSQVVFGGIAAGIGRFYVVAAETRDLPGYMRDSRYLLVWSSTAVLVIGAGLVTVLLLLGFSNFANLASAALVLSLLTGYQSSLNAIQNAARQRAIVSLHGGLDAWLRIALAVGAMLWFGTSSTAVLIGYACSVLLVTLSQLAFLQRASAHEARATGPHHRWAREIWGYSWPFCTWGIFTWMQQVSDRWSLEAFGTTEDVGFYAVVFQLGYSPISIVLGMWMTFLGPIFYQRAGDATDQSRNANVHRLSWRITMAALVVTILGVLAAFSLHDWLFQILVAPGYRKMSHLLPWVILAGGLFAAGQMLSLKLMSEMRSATLLAPKVVTAVLGVSLHMSGAALAGVRGVVAALVAFSFTYLIWMALLGSRVEPQQRVAEPLEGPDHAL